MKNKIKNKLKIKSLKNEIFTLSKTFPQQLQKKGWKARKTSHEEKVQEESNQSRPKNHLKQKKSQKKEKKSFPSLQMK